MTFDNIREILASCHPERREESPGAGTWVVR